MSYNVFGRVCDERVASFERVGAKLVKVKNVSKDLEKFYDGKKCDKCEGFGEFYRFNGLNTVKILKVCESCFDEHFKDDWNQLFTSVTGASSNELCECGGEVFKVLVGWGR